MHIAYRFNISAMQELTMFSNSLFNNHDAIITCNLPSLLKFLTQCALL